MSVHFTEIKCHYGSFSGYLAGSDGFIYSVKSNWRGYGVRKLTGQPSKYGYLRVVMKDDSGAPRRVPVHVVVCSSFGFLKPSELHEVRHLDGNKTNNSVENLAWGTKSENAKDRSFHGLICGRHGNNQKLTESDVISIRASKESNKALANSYGVSAVAIRNIKNRKSWSKLL